MGPGQQEVERLISKTIADEDSLPDEACAQIGCHFYP
jgi:hypothetical protein